MTPERGEVSINFRDQLSPRSLEPVVQSLNRPFSELAWMEAKMKYNRNATNSNEKSISFVLNISLVSLYLRTVFSGFVQPVPDVFGLRSTAHWLCVYGGSHSNIISHTINLLSLYSYGDNGEWILLSSKPVRQVKQYDCCDGWYPEVAYKIHLRRRTLYYIMNFILPCILIAVLTLLVFLLPPESGERMSFGVTVLLSFTILILMLMVRHYHVKLTLTCTSKKRNRAIYNDYCFLGR